MILERFVTTFEGLAVLAPIINGIGGNLGAVLASRVSTALHAGSRSVLCDDRVVHGSRQPHRKAAISLYILVVPTSIIFLMILRALGAGHTPITAVFLSGYSVAALVQVGACLWVLLTMVGRPAAALCILHRQLHVEVPAGPR